jgi:hypothetical protein
VRGKIYKNLDGRFGYEFEHNDISNFHHVDARLIWNFL